MSIPDDEHSLGAYDFHLPPSLIADRPADVRHRSRLMIVDRSADDIAHRHFEDLVDELTSRDLLVFNDSRVLAARLHLAKKDTGGKVEALLVEASDESGLLWRAMARPQRSLSSGMSLVVPSDPSVVVTIESVEKDGFVILRLPVPGQQLSERFGSVPLPPYIDREPDELDADRYQTVYARRDRAGSVAAPTAGLHFSQDLLQRIDARGVPRAHVTLDVGPGTFLPIKVSDMREHTMHAERFDLPAATISAIRETKASGGRVIAVGTTTTRVLESFEDLTPGPGTTSLFIRVGHRFRWVDSLITNFHLPKSTLLVLVSALAGQERILRAYREAVHRGYRFYSYGDAMWIR
ncbi:MAG: tRNA preQ1(34) S-adenosylmethionine ribosyltransferase-isomerase QueA [Myxococcales bacterium]|nr:tRNA preQ1(34) S-adenosylmethionine ribosyltransferase-isomerase QueA [Myxococcales bacterium]